MLIGCLVGALAVAGEAADVGSAGVVGPFARVAGPSAGAPGPVAVFPIPGDRVAAPSSQIAFRGISPFALGTVTVVGSRSGGHAGSIAGDSDGEGGSFIPSAPFLPGETVTVTTPFDVVGAPTGTFSFTVATPAGQVPYNRALIAPRAPGDVWRFHSRLDLAPASVELLRRTRAAASGDIFVAPQFGPVQNGPEILDSGGGLIWFDRVPRGDAAADFRVQSYQGQPVLTWWQGYTTAGVGVGQDYIYDRSYSPVATVRAANGLDADLHEFLITPQGHALITAYLPVYWDASAVHGSKHEIVLDSVVQEIDIPTGLVLFQWDSLDHVRLADSNEPLPVVGPRSLSNPFDYFHVNSIQLDTDGTLIVSARNTWAAYKLNQQSGAIIWTLGGKRSSFRMGPGTQFVFQHDVRSRAPGDRLVTVFDDGAGPPTVHRQSRVLELMLDLRRMTATIVSQDEHSPALLAEFEGNVQQLPDAQDFVGWGQQPFFSEYGARGRVLLDGRFVGLTSSYRSYVFSWEGVPASPPAIAARTAAGKTTVYVSWNGATGVAGWRIESGPSPRALRLVRTAPRRGFETAVPIAAARYVAAQAFGWRGRTLATSATVSAG